MRLLKVIQNFICFIEYDGSQHYKDGIHWTETKDDIQQRDKIKNEYCQKHNIPLLRIPYWELDNINKEWLLNKIQKVTENDKYGEN